MEEVSVIVRTFAGRKNFLRQALQSLERQSFLDFRIYVVEDGSYEAPAVFDTFSKHFQSQIHYQSFPKSNRCVTANWALHQSQSTFINFLDDDDELFPEHLEKLMALANKEPAHVAYYGLAYERPTFIRSLDPLKLIERKERLHYQKNFSVLDLCVSNYLPIQSVLFRRESALESGLLDESLTRLEDWVFWAKLALRGSFAFLDQATSFYRVPASRLQRLEQFRSWKESLPQAREQILSALKSSQHASLEQALRRGWDRVDHLQATPPLLTRILDPLAKLTRFKYLP